MRPHVLTYPDVDGKEYSHARYRYLLQIIFGETAAIDYFYKMSKFAPNQEAKNFLLKQHEEERTHLELLTEYVVKHLRSEEAISPALKKLDKIVFESVENQDYVACVFIQNFILEGLNVSLLYELEHHTDGFLSELITRILKDEIKHTEFGITEVKRILSEDKSIEMRKKLIKLQRKILLHVVRLAMFLYSRAKDLGIPVGEALGKTIDEHLKRIEIIGLELPFVDKLFFKSAKYFLKII